MSSAPAHAEGRGRRRGHPQILADFHAEREAAAVKHEILPDGDTLSAEDDRIGRGMTRLEPAAFVEFAAVGQMLLRNDAEDAPAATATRSYTAVRRFQAEARRRTPYAQARQEAFQAPACTRQAAADESANRRRYSRTDKLRKNAEVGVLFVGGLQHMRNFPRIIHGGRKVNARHGRHRANHTENSGHLNNSFRKRE